MTATVLATEIKAIVLDWAGTVVDHGSCAPVNAFVASFARFGVEVTADEAREPMGLAKRDHIKAMGEQRRIGEAWRAAHGRAFTEDDADAIMNVFTPVMVEAVRGRAGLIPGAAAALETLRARGLSIGSTTGYAREIMEVLRPLAAARGFEPDCVVCAGDTPIGRPSALMMYKCFLDLAVWPAAACVKVDDTPPGIGEGLAAGCWTVGVALTGNLFGLSEEETARLEPGALAARRAKAVGALRAAGGHYVVDGIAELPPVIDEINGRLLRGERP